MLTSFEKANFEKTSEILNETKQNPWWGWKTFQQSVINANHNTCSSFHYAPQCKTIDRLGPRVKNVKNGYPEKKIMEIYKENIWYIRNHCIANVSELHNATRANKVW